jgi:hypothetical protein
LRSWEDVVALSTVSGKAGLAGVVGGACAIIAVPLRAFGRVGFALIGVVSTAAYVLACCWAFGRPIRSAGMVAAVVGTTLVMGTVVGLTFVQTLLQREEGPPASERPDKQGPEDRKG